MKLPQPISDYISDWLAAERGFGYILLDPHGRTRAWGGELQQLGIGPLKQGRPISEQFILMEGLLPLTEPVLQLPLVRMDAEHVLDIHLFKIDDGFGLVLIDASLEAQKQGVLQQKANESALSREQPNGQKKQDAVPMHSDLLENLFFAGNMVALELVGDGVFSPVGRTPGWFGRFCPDTAAGSCRLDPNNVLSFLENFLQEAYDFWYREKVGCIKSGLWIERDEYENEYLFEASAVYTGHSKILLISKEHSAGLEKKNLIQKGREIALSHFLLEKTRNDLQLARDDLEMRVKERTLELEEMNVRLTQELERRKALEAERTEIMFSMQQAQKMEAIGTLAGGIAHDFNNILSAVLGFTELSLADVPKDSQLETNLRHVHAAGLRAKKLISQIMTFSRQTRPETQPVQLMVIIKEAITLLRASVPATIEIRQDLQSDAYIMADPSQLHQVVMNLCTNAIQSMQPDGGVLKLVLRELEAGPEGPSPYPDLPLGSYIEMVVSDTGTGMSPEIQKRIFDPFFTTKEKDEGTGMGLAVVHGIIKNYNGRISVDSTIGQGTTLSMILPTTTLRGIPADQLKTKPPPGDECILFVDDEPMQADLVQKFLTPLGYRVIALTDSTRALHAFLEAPDQFDLVLTDMYMPNMTGKTLSEKIKQIRPEIPVVICSGYHNSVIYPECPNETIDACLVKPYSMHELASTIRKVLDR